MFLKLTLTLSLLVVEQQTWPGFMGAGSTAIDHETLPTKWSPTENISWKTTIAGQGQSAPIIWNDKIFVTTIEGFMKDHCHLIALSVAEGKIIWDYKTGSNVKIRSSRTQSRAAPTPIADANGVYAFFETGNLVALKHDGTLLWEKFLAKEFGPFETNIGLASSPLQTEEAIVLLLDHEGPSCLVAFDKKDGHIIWKTARESRNSYASPALIEMGKSQRHIVCSSSGSVDGYDPRTGKHIWGYENVGGNNVATPFQVSIGKFLVGAQAGMHNEREKEAKKSNFLMTVDTSGDFAKPKVEWLSPTLASFANPMAHQGLAYWTSKVGTVSVYDITTGKEVFSFRLKDTCWAAPFAAGDKIYFFGKDGLTSIIKAGPEFKLLAENRLWPEELSIPTRRNPDNDTSGKEPTKSRLIPAQKTESSINDSNAEKTSAKSFPRQTQGPIFSDPVQYGFAVINGSIVIRTGSAVHLIHQKPN